MFRFTSPALIELGQDASMLYECPTGATMREAPHVYDALRAWSNSEKSSVDIMEQPQWLQSAFAVLSSEQNRLREIADAERQSKADAGYGARKLRGL